MAGLIEFYCRWNETSHASQFKWLDNTFKYFLKIRVLHYSGLQRYSIQGIVSCKRIPEALGNTPVTMFKGLLSAFLLSSPCKNSYSIVEFTKLTA